MRTILAVAVLAACAAGLTGQDDKKYEKEGKFTAKFPTAPALKTQAAGGLTLNLVMAEEKDKGKGGFLVIYSDLPAEKLKAPTSKQVLDTCQEALEKDFKAKVLKSGDTTIGAKKHPAREITAERDEWQIRGSIALAGTRLYQVYVYGSKEFVGGPEATDFLNSFNITD